MYSNICIKLSKISADMSHLSGVSLMEMWVVKALAEAIFDLLITIFALLTAGMSKKGRHTAALAVLNI